jgi:thymidylate synthase ThyX
MSQRISAQVIASSMNEDGVVLTTIQACYPRFIHGEVMTHRVFSRNAMSSRAVPVAKMIEQVRNDPAMSVHWGANQPGMQAKMQVERIDAAIAEWRLAAKQAAQRAEAMQYLGLHKQVANRVLEPYQWMHTIITSSKWGNFFELRDHDDAEPNIRELAIQTKEAMASTTPVTRGPIRHESDKTDPGRWHLPYVSSEERSFYPVSVLRKLSAARCARVSYLTHDGANPDVDKDVALYDRLVGSKPLHASPIEHQARPLSTFGEAKFLQGNFHGWAQFRKMVELDTEESR